MKPILLFISAALFFSFYACKKGHDVGPVGPGVRLDSFCQFAGTPTQCAFKFYYDDGGYVVRMVITASDQSTIEDSFFYDNGHRLTWYSSHPVGNPNQSTVHFIYDGGDRPVRVNTDFPGMPNSTHYLMYYDASGRLDSFGRYDTADTYLGSVSFSYDAAGNAITQTDQRGSGYTYTTSFTYDSHPNPFAFLKGMEYYNLWNYETFNRAVNNCIKRETSDNNNSYSYDYNILGYPTKMTYGDDTIHSLFFYKSM